jgi:dsDNA-specific endonuclease/ATPase MutS2
MYLPEKTIATLEFDKIRQMLADLARTEGARAAALSLMPESDPVRVLRLQRRTTDAKRLASDKGAPPFGSVKGIGEHCDRAKKALRLLRVSFLTWQTSYAPAAVCLITAA